MRPPIPPITPPSPQQTVVVVGGGFAGLTLIQHLRIAPVNIVLIDRCNHHVFQPLLYQVARTIPSQAPSRQRASGGTSEGRHVVTERAGHRPGLRTFGNRCLRILSVLQSRISAAFETCRRTWSSTRTTLHKHGQARPLSPDGVAVKLGSFS